jgi:hypothetical protein
MRRDMRCAKEQGQMNDEVNADDECILLHKTSLSASPKN